MLCLSILLSFMFTYVYYRSQKNEGNQTSPMLSPLPRAASITWRRAVGDFPAIWNSTLWSWESEDIRSLWLQRFVQSSRETNKIKWGLHPAGPSSKIFIVIQNIQIIKLSWWCSCVIMSVLWLYSLAHHAVKVGSPWWGYSSCDRCIHCMQTPET